MSISNKTVSSMMQQAMSVVRLPPRMQSPPRVGVSGSAYVVDGRADIVEAGLKVAGMNMNNKGEFVMTKAQMR